MNEKLAGQLRTWLTGLIAAVIMAQGPKYMPGFVLDLVPDGQGPEIASFLAAGIASIPFAIWSWRSKSDDKLVKTIERVLEKNPALEAKLIQLLQK